MVDRAGKRIEMLLEWRDLAASAGHGVPTVADMMRIGASGEVRPEGVDLAAVEPWSRTIERLLLQFTFGDPNPVQNLPADLRQPSATGRPAPAATVRDIGRGGSGGPVLDALLSWWRAEQGTDRGLRRLKEHQLRSIVTTGSRTEAEVRRHLPAQLSSYARRIAEVIARSTAPPAPSTPAGAPPLDPPTVLRPAADGAAPGPRSAPGRGPAGAGEPDLDRSRHARDSDGRPPAPPAPTSPATAPPATGTPAATPARATADPDADALAALELADYEYTPAPTEPVAIKRRSSPTGTVLTWPRWVGEAGHSAVLYRVVSVDDQWKPLTPQEAQPVVVTESLRCHDERPFTGPVRHVQVWVHAGHDRETAADAEPVLHAECVVVARVRDARVREDGPSVVGQWRVPPGVASVDVLRVPRERARRDGHSDPEFRLPALRPFVNGFVDDGAERGRRYVYEMSVEVEVEGTRYRSDPTKVEVEVSAVLNPVTDLRVVQVPDDRSVVDLEWTTPEAGEVRIFRTPKAPAAGFDERVVRVADLPDARLTDEADVGRPVDVRPDGTSTVVGVPWLDGWTSAYLTPVTVLGDRAAVGPSTLAYRLIEVRHAEIVERTHRQIVTFAWPEGADSVLAYLGGPRETAEEAAERGHPEEISRAQYVAQGGMYFRNRLAPRGCSVHLVPVAHSGGRRITGPVTSLSYPGLLQMSYELHVERGKARPTVLRLWIRAEQEVEGHVFTLVFNPDRLPLHERDGHPLAMAPHGDPRAAAGYQFRPSGLEMRSSPDVFWSTSADRLVGYVRLFVSLPPDQRSTVALFDPPVEQLYLPPQGPL